MRAAWLLVVLSAACGEPPAPPSHARPVRSAAPYARAPTPPPPPEGSAVPEPSPPPADPVRAALEALGPLHARHEVPPSSLGRGAATLAFPGDGRAAAAGWVVAQPPFGAHPIHRWPSAVRVLGAKGFDRWAMVLVETVAWLDQPAGARGVVLVDVDGRRVVPPTEWWGEIALPIGAAVREPADLDAVDLAAFAALRDGAGAGSEAAMKAVVRAASRSPAALASLVGPRGLAVGSVRQGTFVAGDLLAGPAILAGPVATRARELLAGVARGDGCLGFRCALGDAQGEAPSATRGPAPSFGARTDEAPSIAGAFLRAAAAEPRIVLVVEPAPAVRDAPVVGAPKAVAASADAGSVARVLAARAEGMRALGEAPLSASGGTIGIGVSRTTTPAGVAVTSAMSVLIEDGHASVAFLEARPSEQAALRFADVDGDGRTDVVLGPPGGPLVLLAPPPSAQSRELVPDAGSAWAVTGAESPEAAVARAVAVPARGVDAAEACRVVARLASAGGRASAAAPGARAVYRGLVPRRHGSAGELADAPGAIALDALPPEAIRQLVGFCPRLSCSARRPTCEGRSASADGGRCVVTRGRLWFDWVGGKLVVSGLDAMGSVPITMPGPVAPSCR